MVVHVPTGSWLAPLCAYMLFAVRARDGGGPGILGGAGGGALEQAVTFSAGALAGLSTALLPACSRSSVVKAGGNHGTRLSQLVVDSC